MMTANIRNASKPASLTVQIRDAERQVLERQRLVSVCASTLGQNMREQLTSPAALLSACGLGFVAGELTKHQPQARGTDNSPASYSTYFATALNLITWAHTLLAALPLGWIESCSQPDLPSDVGAGGTE
jgi:hypothetical protein